VVASSAVPFASTVPSATICVPTGSAAFSPSLYVVLALTTMLRVKPSRSLIVTVVPATAVTAPSRCGLWVRILGTPPVAVDGAPGAAFGAAGDVGETVAVVDAATAWPPVTGAEAAATAPPPAITAAAIPPIAATRSRCLLALATVADARPPDELPGLPARAPAPDESSVELLPSVRRSAIGAGPFFVPFGTVPTG